MPDPQQQVTKPNKKKPHHRPQQSQSQQPVRSAAEIVKNPPRGYTVELVELSADIEARERLRLMVFQSENGYRVLLVETRRVPRKTTTSDGSTIETVEDFDVLPPNPLGSAVKANLLPDNVLEALFVKLVDVHQLQLKVPPPHERPINRPFKDEKNTEAIMAISRKIRERDEEARRNPPPEPQLQVVEASGPRKRDHHKKQQPEVCVALLMM